MGTASGERSGPSSAPRSQRYSCVGEATAARAVPLLCKAWRGTLRKEDAPPLPERLRSGLVSARALRYWDESCAKGRPSLLKVLTKVCKQDLICGVIASAAQGIIASVVRPLVLKLLIEGLQGDESAGPVAIWIVCVALALLAEGLASADRTYFGADLVGVGAFNAVVALVQRHSSKLSISLQNTGPPIVNLVGNDGIRMIENQKGLILLPLGLSSIIGGIVALLVTLGPVGLLGLVPMFLMLLLNVFFAQLAKIAEQENLTLADQRMRIMGQMVHGIKAIKFAAWEERYMEVIRRARVAECKPLKRWRIYLQYTRQLGRANPIVASCVMFGALAWFDPDALARPGDVFAAANVYLSLRLPMIVLPESMTYFATLRVTLRRFEEFLSLPLAEKRLAVDAGPLVDVHDASFSWPDEGRAEIGTLKGLQLTASASQMVAVVGDVGSGKTTLLSGLIGDLPLLQGRCTVATSVGWVPQRAFVLSGTVERNVSMGRPGSVNEALQAAALDADVARLGGVAAEVGERGVTLSGGQAQRLSVARALYGRPRVLIADDPLSAVDAVSSAAIFSTVQAFARDGGCVIMALNQLHLVPRFDKIVVMNGQGGPVVANTRDGPETLAAVEGELGQALRQALTGNLKRDAETASEADNAAVNVELDTGKAKTTMAVDKESKGRMNRGAIWQYIRGMGLCYAFFCAGLTIATYGAMAFTDRWLAVWVAAAVRAKEEPDTAIDHAVYSGIYYLGSVVFIVGLFWTSYSFAEGGVRSSRNLHQLCLERLMHAPVGWFESMPSGRILSRFSSDLAMVDQAVAQWADNIAQLSCQLVLMVSMVLLVAPFCAVPFAVAIALFVALMRLVQVAARDSKRWAIDAMSPVLTVLSETHAGRQSLRTMDMAPLLTGLCHEALDRWASFFVAAQLPVDFGMIMSSAIAILIGCSTALVLLWDRDSYEPSFMAFALTYTFLVPYFMSFFGDILNRLLISFTGLERLMHYSDLEQEPPWHCTIDKEHDGCVWPRQGGLQFENVTLVYRQGLAPALTGVSFVVNAGQSVGVVGRSGAGKSSLLALLFRLREPTAGSIYIDSVNIAQLGLQLLRRRLAILPQEPLLFPGSCRDNLDPFAERTDAEVQAALEAVGLANLAEGVGAKGSQSGGSLAALSIGERQLVALARLLLRGQGDSKIVLFDEPTSSVDAATDLRVQRTLQERFTTSTVMTVAHRLQTVLNSDMIMVFERGQLLEQGQPFELLRDTQSHFASLAREAGDLIQSKTIQEASI